MAFKLFELNDTQEPQQPQQTQGTYRPGEAPKDACRAYQANTLKAELHKAEITKGIIAGESPYKLLLKAIECISLMTGEPAYYEHNRANIISIHGLLDPEPRQIELEEIQARLNKLEEAATQEPGNSRIQAAIKEHQSRAEGLRTQRA